MGITIIYSHGCFLIIKCWIKFNELVILLQIIKGMEISLALPRGSKTKSSLQMGERSTVYWCSYQPILLFTSWYFKRELYFTLDVNDMNWCELIMLIFKFLFNLFVNRSSYLQNKVFLMYSTNWIASLRRIK